MLEANREFDDNSTGQGKQSTELKNKNSQCHCLFKKINVLNNAGIILTCCANCESSKKIEKKKSIFFLLRLMCYTLYKRANDKKQIINIYQQLIIILMHTNKKI